MSTEKRREPGRRERRKTPERQTKQFAPDIVTTQPKSFEYRRLVLRILSMVAIVLAISIGLSIFFRVQTVTVSGCDRYSAWTVAEASGIQKGDSLLFFGEAAAGSKILDALPYIKSVRFAIEMPGCVHIIVEEVAVSYAVQATDGSWWMITADGVVAEQTDALTAEKTTILRGIILQSPEVGQPAQAYQEDTQAVTTAKEKLEAALQLVQLLERNEIMGKMSYVDVSNLQNLRMWYENQYQIQLHSMEQMEQKIATVKAAIPKIGSYQTGTMELVKDGEIWKIVFTNQS